MPQEIKKSYNPFKMLGSQVGFILGLFAIPSAYIANHVLFLHPFAWLYFFGVQIGDPEGIGILAVLTLWAVFFVYGWVIHSFLRKIGQDNPVLVIILVSMLVILPVTYGLIKDQQTFQASLNSADSDILAAKATTEGVQRNADQFNRESVAMNAIMVMAKAETDISMFTNKMLSVAQDESIAIDVRLTAVDILGSKVGEMSSNQKKTLNDQLLMLGDHVNKSSTAGDMDKERMAGRITMLQNLLAK